MNKIRVVYLLCFWLVIMSLSACQKESLQTTPPMESLTPSQIDASVNTNTVKWVTPADNIDMGGMNVYWQHDNLQFVADNDAKLSIYARADKDENGDLLFDDGQDWVVLMESSLGNYPLFPRQYVQLGGVSAVVFNEYIDDDIISHVLITVQQTAGYQLYDCIFDVDEEAFKILSVYDAQNINFILDSKNFY